jgi:signal transduction histidine kinase
MSSDIDKARQILVNLLGNAVKFTDTGSVTLRLSRGGRSVRVDITDTGIGIPGDELPRLFRPFAQVDTGLTRRHGGTGLGLYISRRLATLLGGHIEVTSAVGSGSTFSVVLPVTWEGHG